MSSRWLSVLVVAAALVLLSLGAALSWVAYDWRDSNKTERLLAMTQQAIQEQRGETQQVLTRARLQMDSLYSRMARLKVQIQRIDALGETLVVRAGLPIEEEFSIRSDSVPIGGAGDILGDAYSPPQFVEDLEGLINDLAQRENKLRFVSDYLPDINATPRYSVNLSNWPVSRGWLSSQYGRRIDPFHGKLSFHHGIDFAGVVGDEIHSVAAGVVSKVTRQGNYGVMVEIDHGNGWKTRYAHCKSTLVRVSSHVSKGQAIAIMGSTGRSTGPHVHFEVLNNNRRVNPNPYIKGGKIK